MEYKSHKIRISNLPDDQIIYRTTNKSLPFAGFLWILTIICLASGKIVFFLAILAYSLFITFKKEVVIFEGGIKYFVMYQEGEETFCKIYYLNDIEKWNYQPKPLNSIITFKTLDGEKITITNGCDGEMFTYFKKVLADKEVKETL